MSEPENDSKRPNFWDSMPGLVLLVAAILLARYYILEPYKIPSGSMEPTLVGHEDFGDRIVTNKLAFAPASQVYTVIGGSLVVIALCFAASRAWKRTRAILFWILMILAIPGGLLVALQKEAVAREPKRFDVTVFNYNTIWNVDNVTESEAKEYEAQGRRPDSHVKNERINYIKRLWALPGEEIRISGGDIFLKKMGGYEILRKPSELQEVFWFPVSRAWSNVHMDLSDDDRRNFRFPWHGVDEKTPGATLHDNQLELDGAAPVRIEYKHSITNIYLKQGRWPFRHSGCKAVKAQESVKDANGIVWRNPSALTESITAFIPHTSHGVQCPQCGQLLFPITQKPASHEPQITPAATRFAYGGDYVSGDQRLDMTMEILTPGSLILEVGSNRHRAVWAFGTAVPTDSSAHAVTAIATLTPGTHKISLSYIDGTVLALLDGREVERRNIDVQPLGSSYKGLTSLAQVSFGQGFKGSVTQLDLYRDFFYSSPEPISRPGLRDKALTLNNRTQRGFIADDGSFDYWAKLPSDHFLMLGDNSAGSLDGRMWGFVPREELIGRAGVVWWPPSRWRVIK